jgi:hypothetical protein
VLLNEQLLYALYAAGYSTLSKYQQQHTRSAADSDEAAASTAQQSAAAAKTQLLQQCKQPLLQLW